MSRLMIVAAALALLPASAALAQYEIAPPPPLPAGTHAPAFTTRTVNGQTLTLRSLRGKVVLLDYWATWCGPCQMATPMLENLSRHFGPRGLAVVGMSVDDARSVRYVKPFMSHFGVTYTVTAAPQANGQAQYAYRATGIPSQYLIDKKGVVRWSQSGFSLNERRRLTPLIKRLLAE